MEIDCTLYGKIAFTYKIKATGSRGAREIMASVFCVYFGVVLVVCNRIYNDE
jgi:hypothetical protein